MTSALSDRIKELEAALADAQAWTDADKPLPEDDEILSHHPMKNGSHDAHTEAMRLVGAKRSKAALVDLTSWLLQRATAAEAERDRLREAGEEFCDAVENDVAHGVDVHDDKCGVCRSRAAFRKVLDPPTPPGEGISDE